MKTTPGCTGRRGEGPLLLVLVLLCTVLSNHGQQVVALNGDTSTTASMTSASDSVFAMRESFLNHLAANIPSIYSGFCRFGPLTRSTCISLSCTTELREVVATCTNSSAHGNLVGQGCKNCTGRQLTLSESSVQLLTEPNDSPTSSSAQAQSTQDVLWTSGLDSAFASVFPGLRWQYFTTQAKALTRTYPGLQLNASECFNDSRTYPRYSLALSGYKEIVIAVDNRAETFRSSVLFEAVRKILDSLSPNDRFAVVYFDTRSANVLQTGVGDNLQRADQTSINAAKIALGMLKSASFDINGAPSYHSAFLEAFSVLSVRSSGGCVRRVVMLLTNGGDATAASIVSSTMAIENSRRQGDIILSYSVSSDSVLSAVAKRFGGFHTTVSRSARLPFIAALYSQYLWLTAGDRTPQVAWTGSRYDAATQSNSVTLSRLVFKSKCAENTEETLDSLLGVVALDLSESSLLSASGLKRQDLLNQALASRWTCNITEPSVCDYGGSLSHASLYPLESSTDEIIITTANCNRSMTSPPQCPCSYPTLSPNTFLACDKRETEGPDCCKVMDSNCTTSSPSSGFSSSTIITISIWIVIIFCYPIAVVIKRFVQYVREVDCSLNCRRRRNPRGRSTTRRGGRPAAAAAAARATEPEVELEDYTNRELTNAPPPSYNIALATTSPIDTEPNSPWPETFPSDDGGCSLSSCSSEGETVVRDDAPPPAYEDIANSTA